MNVIIIGAGIGGLTTALALRRAGIGFEIYERASELREVGAGISLWANAIGVLERLGLGDVVRERSVSYRRSALRRTNGRAISETSLDELIRRFGSAVVVFHRAELLSMLREAVGVEIRLDHTCSGFDTGDDGVHVRFENGTHAHGEILVAADGIHSVIRAQIHGKEPVRYAGYIAWRCVTRFDTAGLGVSETWGCGCRFGIIPISDNRVYWYATRNEPPAAGDPAGPTTQKLLEIFGGWHPPIPELIRASQPSAILRNEIADRDPLTHWGMGPVTLLGDAAHPMTPNLGQGGCQAIEDAIVLARVLKTASDPGAAVRAYEAERIARTTPIVLQSRRVGVLGQWQNPIACALRNAFLAMLPASAMMRQLDAVVGYRGHLAP